MIHMVEPIEIEYCNMIVSRINYKMENVITQSKEEIILKELDSHQLIKLQKINHFL